MAKVSFRSSSSTNKMVDQMGARTGHKWKHLSPELVQTVRLGLDAWRNAVECRTGGLFRSTDQRKNTWKRTFSPAFTLKQLNWEKGISRIADWIVEDWNSQTSSAEPKLTLTCRDLIAGREPPGPGMRPRDAADLQQPPQVLRESRDHLLSYLNDLTKAIATAQLQHVTAERTLRETRATTYESLGLWEPAATELKHLARANRELLEHVYAVRAMLRRGVALYRLGAFADARDELMDAIKVIKCDLPTHADLRTEIAVWDYLGLCLIRLGESDKALNEVYLLPEHEKRVRLLSTPLGDASRAVRMGIAYLELNQLGKSKAAFLLGAKKRASVKAWPEAARALRYLGHWYFRRGDYPAALSVWEIALKRQRVVGDDIEEARLLCQRGEAFRQMKELATTAPNAWREVRCGLTSKIFPNNEELRLLKRIQGPYTDIFDNYPVSRAQFSRHAYASYRQSIDTAHRKGLQDLIAAAEPALTQLCGDEIVC